MLGIIKFVKNNCNFIKVSIYLLSPAKNFRPKHNEFVFLFCVINSIHILVTTIFEYSISILVITKHIYFNLMLLVIYMLLKLYRGKVGISKFVSTLKAE